MRFVVRSMLSIGVVVALQMAVAGSANAACVKYVQDTTGDTFVYAAPVRTRGPVHIGLGITTCRRPAPDTEVFVQQGVLCAVGAAIRDVRRRARLQICLVPCEGGSSAIGQDPGQRRHRVVLPRTQLRATCGSIPGVATTLCGLTT